MSTNNCPFCHQENHCNVNSASCWCLRESIPSSLINLLPVNSLHKECICTSCVKRFQQDEILFEASLNGKT